jgi:hypothetical protein
MQDDNNSIQPRSEFVVVVFVVLTTSRCLQPSPEANSVPFFYENELFITCTTTFFTYYILMPLPQ